MTPRKLIIASFFVMVTWTTWLVSRTHQIGKLAGPIGVQTSGSQRPLQGKAVQGFQLSLVSIDDGLPSGRARLRLTIHAEEQIGPLWLSWNADADHFTLPADAYEEREIGILAAGDERSYDLDVDAVAPPTERSRIVAHVFEKKRNERYGQLVQWDPVKFPPSQDGIEKGSNLSPAVINE